MEDEKLGEGARAVGRELLAAALAGDGEKCRALAVVFDQAEGKPKETIDIDAQVTSRVVIEGWDSDTPVHDLPDEGNL